MVCMVLGVCSFVPLVGVVLGLGAIVVGLVALTGRTGHAAWKGISWGALGGFVFQAVLFGAVVPALVGCSDSEEGNGGEAENDPRVLTQARRALCAQHMNYIGMGLVAYAASNDEQFPVNTGTHDNRIEPTTANNLWLLRSEGLLSPSEFVCPAVKGDPGCGKPLVEGSKPMTGTTTFSYSYQAVLEARVAGPSMLDNPALVVAADRTNVQAGIDKLSLNHGGEGMNVLALDTHTEWVTSNNVGIDGDNIFTCSGKSWGSSMGDLTSPHVSRNDSYLVGP